MTVREDIRLNTAFFLTVYCMIEFPLVRGLSHHARLRYEEILFDQDKDIYIYNNIDIRK